MWQLGNQLDIPTKSGDGAGASYTSERRVLQTDPDAGSGAKNT